MFRVQRSVGDGLILVNWNNEPGARRRHPSRFQCRSTDAAGSLGKLIPHGGFSRKGQATISKRAELYASPLAVPASSRINQNREGEAHVETKKKLVWRELYLILNLSIVISSLNNG